MTDLDLSEMRCKDCEHCTQDGENYYCENKKEDIKDPRIQYCADIIKKKPRLEEIEARLKFESPDLLLKIHYELSKKHLHDNKVKLTTFFVCCTAYQEEPDRHKSQALKGPRSVGKDNVIKTCLSQFPKKDWIFLTRATTATIEDDIQQYRIVAYSEINLSREDRGANAELLEVIKQLSEGGVSSLKKDALSGFKTTKHSRPPQKTVLYSTTESSDDDELSTRFLITSVDAPQNKIQSVIQDTCENFAGKSQHLDTEWIAYGIEHLFKQTKVIIPFANKLPQTFFDTQDPRAMRDVKRFLAIVAAIAWIHQLQRAADAEGRVLAQPYDFLVAMIITAPFFNYTYAGIGDQRIQRFIDAMNEYCDSQPTLVEEERNTFPRHKIQEALGCATNTIKSLSKGCQSLSIIRFLHNDQQGSWYLRCQKGVKRVLMGVKWSDFMQDFFIKGGIKLSDSDVSNLHLLAKLCENQESQQAGNKFDTLNLTPSTEKVADPLDFLGKEPLPFDVLMAKLHGWSEDSLNTWLDRAKAKGDVLENPCGHYGVLQ